MERRPIDVALAWAREADWNQTELAARLQVTPASITNWKARGMPSDYHQAVATLFGRTVDELLRPEKTPTDHRTDSTRWIPVVGEVQGGADGYLEEFGYPVGYGPQEVSDRSDDPNAYAVRVRGDSMRPRIKSGELLVVEPNRPCNPGEDVVVKLRDGRKMVKEFLYRRDGECAFKSINEDHRNVTVRIEDVESIHPIRSIIARGSSAVREAPPSMPDAEPSRGPDYGSW